MRQLNPITDQDLTLWALRPEVSDLDWQRAVRYKVLWNQELSACMFSMQTALEVQWFVNNMNSDPAFREIIR